MPRISSDYEQKQKTKIIEGAARVFAEHGYRQTTIDQICEALTISKGAIYTYFKNKEELFISTMDYIFEKRYILFAGAYGENDPLPVRFKKVLERTGSLATSEDYTVYARLSVEGFLESARIPGLQMVKTQSYNRFYQLLHDLLTQGQAAEQIQPKVDVDSMIAVLMATLDGFMMHSLVQGREIDAERVRELVFELFSQALNDPSSR